MNAAITASSRADLGILNLFFFFLLLAAAERTAQSPNGRTDGRTRPTLDYYSQRHFIIFFFAQLVCYLTVPFSRVPCTARRRRPR